MIAVRLRNTLLSLFAWTSATIVLLATGWLLFEIAKQGVSGLSFEFLTGQVEDFGRSGGILPMIFSTMLIVLICLAVSLPLGLGAAVYLAEYARTGVAIWVRRSLDILSGVPSIIFGLFGSAFFCVTLQLGYSILSGGLTLACMVLPLFVRIAEQGIREVPLESRHAAAALGLGKATTLFRIILPAAMPAIIAATALGVGRALAETAALIFTSGSVSRMPQSLFDSGRSLSVHIYEMSTIIGGNAKAFATAMTLVVTILLINGIAQLIARQAVGRTSQAKWRIR